MRVRGRPLIGRATTLALVPRRLRAVGSCRQQGLLGSKVRSLVGFVGGLACGGCDGWVACAAVDGCCRCRRGGASGVGGGRGVGRGGFGRVPTRCESADAAACGSGSPPGGRFAGASAGEPTRPWAASWAGVARRWGGPGAASAWRDCLVPRRGGCPQRGWWVGCWWLAAWCGRAARGSHRDWWAWLGAGGRRQGGGLVGESGVGGGWAGVLGGRVGGERVVFGPVGAGGCGPGGLCGVPERVRGGLGFAVESGAVARVCDDHSGSGAVSGSDAARIQQRSAARRGDSSGLACGDEQSAQPPGSYVASRVRPFPGNVPGSVVGTVA